MQAVEIDDLCIDYGSVRAVDHVSFTASYGRITALLGPNGAGKTSTIECCEGYLTPTSGTVRVCGVDPIGNHQHFSHKVGVMLQSGGVALGARVGELVELFAGYYTDPVAPTDAIEMVGLAERTQLSVRSLSGGERQRLALALALIGRPEVLFLDEPTAGVDLAGKQLIRSTISSLVHNGAAVIMTSHDLNEVEAIAHDIVIIDHGQVIAHGSSEELLSNTERSSFSFRAAASLDLHELSQILGYPVTSAQAGLYKVVGPPTPQLIARLTHALAEKGVLIGDLQAGREGLESVFARLTADHTPTSKPTQPQRRRGRS